MKKLIAVLSCLISLSAFANNEMSYTYNKLGGMIFFTYTECVYLNTGNRVPNQFYVYSTDTAGNKLVDGCYEYKYPFYFIEWNRGGRLSVNVNTVVPLTK
jgi:hypothetical protein